MSQQQHTSNGGQSDPYALPTSDERGGESLPAFRSFPARIRNSPVVDTPGEPASGRTSAQHVAQPTTILGPSDLAEGADDINANPSYRAPAIPGSLQRHAASELDALPAFRPFPSASPSSRYASHSSSRVESLRPSAPSRAFAPESMTIHVPSGAIRPTQPAVEPSALGPAPAPHVPR
ncbi:hypothetical protein RhiJN_07158 [Ceratobasidium sp. AG-Ba]|nr:hypothetical protein RhiJN_07158 [Ceratobasidium sp. AG-Ba]QRW08031.1 hypothetical protein RhiLY_07030 [Ceratobasidium sp. AG-Ba]